MKVFITGDRSAHPAMFGFAAIELLRAVGRGETVVTGESAGIEDAVRQIAKQADIEIEVALDPPLGDNGKPDWDVRHKALAAQEDVRFVLIHSDPMDSRIGASLMRCVGDERLTIVTPADLLIG